MKNYEQLKENHQNDIKNLETKINNIMQENTILQKKNKFFKKKIIGYQNHLRVDGMNDSFTSSIHDSHLSK